MTPKKVRIPKTRSAHVAERLPDSGLPTAGGSTSKNCTVDDTTEELTYGKSRKLIDPWIIPAQERRGVAITDPRIVNEARLHSPIPRKRQARPTGALGDQPAARPDAGKAPQAVLGPQPANQVPDQNPADRGEPDEHAAAHRAALDEFRIYWRRDRAYDLKDWIDRFAISGEIQRAIRQCDQYLSITSGPLWAEDHPDRVRTKQNLIRHLAALRRLDAHEPPATKK